MNLWSGDTPLFSKMAVSVMDGIACERWNVRRNDLGWPKGLSQQISREGMRPGVLSRGWWLAWLWRTRYGSDPVFSRVLFLDQR